MDKTFQTKEPLKNPREQLRENLYRRFLSGIFVLGLLKMGGSEMCDILLWGPGMCDKVRQREGSKLAKNSVTYFMDGPLTIILLCRMLSIHHPRNHHDKAKAQFKGIEHIQSII